MEEELALVEEGRGDAGSSEGESGVDMSNNSPGPNRKGRGRPKGSKKLQVWVTHVDLLTDLSNGGVTLPKRGRGRPKRSVNYKPEGAMSEEERDCIDSPPRKRGRPKGSPNKKTQREMATTLSNGSSTRPKRGRPRKIQLEREAEEEADEEAVEEEEEEEAVPEESNSSSKPQRGRGRPRKHLLPSPEELEKPKERKSPGRPRKHPQADPVEEGSTSSSSCSPTDVSPRKRGRPKGSFSQKPPSLNVHAKAGGPGKVVHKDVTLSSTLKNLDGSQKESTKRGRPRKNPLSSPVEIKKRSKKVWKPLGRPRKYPRAPDEDLPSHRRAPGRPRKHEYKRGSHLRKSVSSDGNQRKLGRPPNAIKGENGSPRKPGRPKGSPNKHKAVTRVETSATGKLQKASPAKRQEHDGGESETKYEGVNDEEINEETGFAPIDETDVSGVTETAAE